MTIEIKNQWMEQIEKLILQTDMKYHFTLQEQAGLLEEIVYQQCIEHNFMKGCDTPNTNSSTTLKHSSNDYLVEENHETDYFNLLIPPSSPPSDYITTAPTSQFKNYQTLPSQWVVPNVTLSPSCFFNTTAQYESNLSSGGTKMTSSLSNDTTIFQPTFNDEQCIQFLSILLHAADISNTVRPWHLSKQWSDLIVQEFFRQGDYEKLAGMDVSPGMDRDVSNQPDISLTFGDLLVRPYFEALTNLLPDAYIFLDILENNRDEWLNLKLKTQDQEKSPSQQLPTKLNNKRLSVIQYPNGHPYNDQQQQQQQHIQERQFPNGLLPIPKSSLSDKSNATATIKSERRVSVAAGTISIPDDLDLSGKSNKYKGRRGQAGLRSYSLVTDRVDIFRKFSYVPPPRNHRSSTLPVIHKRMSLHPQSSVLATSSPLTSTISNHSNQSNTTTKMVLTLEVLLEDPTSSLFQAFFKYLQQQYCIENLLFWLEVEKYKLEYQQHGSLFKKEQDDAISFVNNNNNNNNKEDIIHQCLDIIHTYIQPNSNREINIPCEMRIELLNHIFQKQDYQPSIFTPASQAVFELMRANSFIPWLSEYDPTSLPSPPPSSTTTPTSYDSLPSSPFSTTTIDTTTDMIDMVTSMVSSLSSPDGWMHHLNDSININTISSSTSDQTLNPRASISSFRSFNDPFSPSGLFLVDKKKTKHQHHHLNHFQHQKLGLRQQSLLKRVKASFINITHRKN
ncbi:unnamed protein product [Cunninghamella blakesleeana]